MSDKRILRGVLMKITTLDRQEPGKRDKRRGQREEVDAKDLLEQVEARQLVIADRFRLLSFLRSFID